MEPNFKPSGRHATVLLVDPDEQFRAGVEDHFLRAGFSCTSTASPERALELLRLRRFDLMVTETHLDGYPELYLAEQSQAYLAGLPVLLLASEGSLGTIQKAFELPTINYLTKPVEAADVVQCACKSMMSRPRHIATWRVIEDLSLSIDDLKTTLTAKHSGDDGQTLLRITIRRLVGSLQTLWDFVQRDGSATQLCRSIQCPCWTQHEAVLEDAITVLQETKRRFKSKELAELREQLVQHLA